MMPMARYCCALFALIVLCCTTLPAVAADITIACIGPESDDCPMALDVRLERETLVASFSLRKADGTWQREEVYWCKGMGVDSPYRWLGPAWGICEPTGSFRAVNGEFTKRQLAEASVLFSTRQVQSWCEPGYPTTASCSGPGWSPSAGKLRIACIGPESDDCPVSVDVKLQGDGLLASFYPAPRGVGATPVLVEWCSGFSVTGDSPLRWWSSKGSPCPLWGTSRPVNGELTKRELAEGYVTFETRTMEALCQFRSSSPTNNPPICAKLPR